LHALLLLLVLLTLTLAATVPVTVTAAVMLTAATEAQHNQLQQHKYKRQCHTDFNQFRLSSAELSWSNVNFDAPSP
jgi:MFS superfamily sulfate permease-like transporter